VKIGCRILLMGFLFPFLLFACENVKQNVSQGKPGGLAVDWKCYATNAEGELLFYDTQSIFRGQDSVMVMIKIVLTDKGKADLIKKFPDKNGIENISYMINRGELDCLEHRCRVTSTVWYSSDGSIISSFNDPNRQFMEVLPNSGGDFLSKAICK
jgi:hypothetical protein